MLATDKLGTHNTERAKPPSCHSILFLLDISGCSDDQRRRHEQRRVLVRQQQPSKGVPPTLHAYFAPSLYTPLKHHHTAPRIPSRRKKDAVASGRTTCASKYTVYVTGGVFGPRGGYSHRPLRVESRSWCDAPGTKTIAAALLLNVKAPVIAAFGGLHRHYDRVSVELRTGQGTEGYGVRLALSGR